MKITTQIIKDLKPCEDRLDNFIEHYPDFKGDHEDFLLLDKITHKDKLWVTLRLMDRIDVEVFAIDCVVDATTAYAVAAAEYTYAVYNYAADDYTYTVYTYAADAAASAAYAAYAAYAADVAAEYAAASAASAAAFFNYEASGGTACSEKERQLDAICYLIDKRELSEN